MTDNPLLVALQQRNASSKLAAPGPDADQLQEIFKAALRAPDHGLLRPWRFLVIEGAGRERLGELFVAANEQKLGQLDAEKQQKIASKPLRAPLIIAVICCPQEHPKVPVIEQQLSTACAAQNILLAVEALGYAGIWRTGDMAFDPYVAKGLGLAAHEQLLGYLYIGTRDMPRKPLPEHDLSAFVQPWPQS